MPMLRVRCQRCREWIPTGIVMDEQTFREATDRTLITHCPKCNNAQAWTLDDVDRSVFKPNGSASAASRSDAPKL